MRALKITGIVVFWLFAAWAGLVIWKQDEIRQEFLQELRNKHRADLRSAAVDKYPYMPATVVDTFADETSSCMSVKARLRLQSRDIVLYTATFGLFGKDLITRRARPRDSDWDECIGQGVAAAGERGLQGLAKLFN